MLDKQYWEDRYLNDTASWNIGYASTPIKEYFDQVTDKSLRILIPGCGNAYEAEYLFNKGFTNVFVIDYSEVALNNFKARVPNFPVQNIICADFFNHAGTYDIIVEQTFFCSLDIALRTKYIQQVHQLLVVRGKLVGLLFNTEFQSQGPPFGGNTEEYLALFQFFFCIKTLAPAYNSIPQRLGRELFVVFIKK